MQTPAVRSVFSSLRALRAPSYMLAIAAAALLLSGSAKANTIYSYTGNTFTEIVDPIGSPGRYTTSMKVTGTIEMASPLGANYDNLSALEISALVLSFSFTDGQQTFDQSFINLLTSFIGLKTDQDGIITEWDIYLQSPIFFNAVQMIHTTSSPTEGYIDEARMMPILTLNADYARVINNPGVWAVVPEPSTLSLLMTGFLGLALSRHRRA